MKYAILFLFLPLFAFAQQREVASDTSYFAWYPDGWYLTFQTNYVSGHPTFGHTFYGDTSAAYAQLKDGIQNATAGRAVDVSTVSLYGRRNKEDLRLSDEFLAKAGISVVDSIEAQNSEPFLQAGWVMKSAGVEVPILFNTTATKRLRYQYNSTTNRQTDLMGSVIRLRDFPITGSTSDFYRDPTGRRWVTLDRLYILIPPGGSEGQQRR